MVPAREHWRLPVASIIPAILIFACIGAIYLLLTPSASVPSPKTSEPRYAVAPAHVNNDATVAFSPPQVDLGSQFWNAEVPISLELRNDTDSDFNIVETLASCSCTTPFDDYVGRSVRRRTNLTFQVLLKVGTETGLLNRTFGLLGSNGHSCHANIRVSVIRTWSVGRDYVDFGNVIATDLDGKDHDLRIGFQSIANCQITEIESNGNWLATTLVKRRDSSTAVHLHPVLDNMMPGRNIAAIRILTNDAFVPEQTLLVSANLVDDLDRLTK